MASSPYLHLVDVGGMVPAAAEVSGSFTAAVRNELLIHLNPHTVVPVRVVVTAATLKLSSGKAQKRAEEVDCQFQI